MVKNYCLFLVLLFSGLLVRAQNVEISKDKKPNSELLGKLLNEYPDFKCDTVSANRNLSAIKNNGNPGFQVIYKILHAEEISNCVDKINSQSTHLFENAIKQSEKISPELETVANISYAKYLYKYRSMERALPYFMKGSHLLETNPVEKQIRPQDSYKWLGYYLGTIGDSDASKDALEKAKSLTRNKHAEYATILDALGRIYLEREQFDNAEKYFEEASRVAKKVNDEMRYAKAIGNLSVIYAKRGETSRAKKLILEDIMISERLSELQNTMFAQTLLGEVLIQENNYTEAETVLKKALKTAQSKSYFQINEIKIQQLLTEVYRNQNNREAELHGFKRISELEHNLKKTDGDQALNNAHLLMQKSKLEQANKEAHYQQEKSAMLRNIYLGLIFFSLVLAGFIFANSRKKLLNRELMYKQKVLGLEMDKLKFEKKLSETQENLDNQVEFLKNKNVQINRLKSEIEKIRNSKSFYLEEEQGHLSKLLESHLMTDENWENFKREFRKVHPEFYNQLQSEFPDLTDSNYRIILLKKLDFNNTEISQLLGITTDAVKKSNQRMKKKLGDRYDELAQIISKP
ncbi:tetratricopeptide repeat protein [Chryseobacterium suipulveris]|uniref:Tetratricopeptide repeat protein n=1 Tax=Chryseobacterium suipulveris TaxID=2929800 RepID=A0ABY4BR26_9FLAO|nr:tetratricopeptide repeat protein [Chryseobacterium suipulveris]UOE40168.1 tetratricopeptide repeat protein [Chryseobacterium suipulveris]